jgi:hypothetical protein
LLRLLEADDWTVGGVGPDPSVESDVGDPEGPDPDEAEEGLVLVE